MIRRSSVGTTCTSTAWLPLYTILSGAEYNTEYFSVGWAAMPMHGASTSTKNMQTSREAGRIIVAMVSAQCCMNAPLCCSRNQISVASVDLRSLDYLPCHVIVAFPNSPHISVKRKFVIWLTNFTHRSDTLRRSSIWAKFIQIYIRSKFICQGTIRVYFSIYSCDSFKAIQLFRRHYRNKWEDHNRWSQWRKTEIIWSDQSSERTRTGHRASSFTKPWSRSPSRLSWGHASRVERCWAWD